MAIPATTGKAANARNDRLPGLSKRWAWVAVPMVAILALEAAQDTVLGGAILPMPVHLGLLAVLLLGGASIVAAALFRDAVMLIAFAVATISLLPGLFLNVTFPVFAPLSALIFFVALTIKLFTDSDDDPRAFVALSLLLVVASTLYFVPLFFGVQAMEQAFMGEIAMFLVSSTNNAWAVPILIVALLGYGGTGTYIFWRFTRTLRGAAGPQPTETEAAVPRAA